MLLIRKPMRAVAILLSSLLAAAAMAHHSTAEFDYSKQVTIKGKVKEVQWTNTQSYIHLLLPGKDGCNGLWKSVRPRSTSTWAGARTASLPETR